MLIIDLINIPTLGFGRNLHKLKENNILKFAYIYLIAIINFWKDDFGYA